MLQKRLRWLLEPLVQSLGESADNISFLLRQAEILGNKYHPIEVSHMLCTSPPLSPSGESPSMLSPSSLETQTTPIKSPVFPDSLKRDDLSILKLKVICASARQLLLKFVKKDVNLTPYPGVMQIPSHLYARVTTKRVPTPPTNGPSDEGIAKLADFDTRTLPRLEQQCVQKINSPPRGKRKAMIDVNSASPEERVLKKRVASGKGTKVRFSPDTRESSKHEDEADSSFATWDETGEVNTLSFGEEALFQKHEETCLSPIPQSNSPSSTPSSVITVGQGSVQIKVGSVDGRKDITRRKNHSKPEEPNPFFLKKRKTSKVKEKRKKKKSLSVPIFTDRKANVTDLPAHKLTQSSSERTVYDSFEFVDNDDIRESPATSGKPKRSKKEARKPSKRSAVITPKKSLADLKQRVTITKKRPSGKKNASQQHIHTENKDIVKGRRQTSARSPVNPSASCVLSQSTRRRSPRNQMRGMTS